MDKQKTQSGSNCKSSRRNTTSLINIRGQIGSNPKLRFVAYVYMCYHTDFLIRRNFQFDRFNDHSYALLKSFSHGERVFLRDGPVTAIDGLFNK